jgi:hypothetical protein
LRIRQLKTLQASDFNAVKNLRTAREPFAAASSAFKPRQHSLQDFAQSLRLEQEKILIKKRIFTCLGLGILPA